MLRGGENVIIFTSAHQIGSDDMSSVINNSSVHNLTYSSEQSLSNATVSSERAQSSFVKQITEPNSPEVMSKDSLNDAIRTLNQVPVIKERNLSFSIDDLSGRSVIKLRDKQTDEIIKQIPSEELLKVAQDVKRLQEQMGQSIGLLVDNKV